ncbi:hypothetical protein CDD81_6185 [Ophiocordyceps australis]|uniref:Cytochrome b561 domain-containing protein n=1 Tax=Ophiocordyceps australis TaxID=1399860 RepID=A0A2C5Y6I2_9HYPO|nr:hypothetical protein CDD81_6185 [Ophiocordyceps australis]
MRLASLGSVVLLAVASGCHGQEGDSQVQRGLEPWWWEVGDLIGEETLEAILGDRRLRRTYISFVGIYVKASRRLLEEWELSDMLDKLEDHMETVKALDEEHVGEDSALELRRRGQEQGLQMAKRGFVGNLFGQKKDKDKESSGESSGEGAGGDEAGDEAGDNGDDAGPIKGLVSKVANKLIERVAGMAAPALAGAGFFGGVGAGEGVAQGLQLVTAKTSMTAGASVASDNEMSSSGFNSAIERTTMGLTATALRALRDGNVFDKSAVDVGQLVESLGSGLGTGAASGLKLTDKALEAPRSSGNSSSTLSNVAGSFGFGASKALTENINTTMGSLLPPIDVGATALQLGSGIGQGAASGLRLSNKQELVPSSADASNVAGNFGFGASKALTENINTTMGSLLPPIDVGATALQLGSGLGQGAASGLRLSNKQELPPSPADAQDIPGIAGSFAFGLSKALADGSRAQLDASGLGAALFKFAGPAASGIGKGLGSGAAIGLGLQPDKEAAVHEAAGDMGAAQVSSIAQTLAEGLASSFLANGTTSKALSSLSSASSLDLGRIANGFARGLVTGAGDGVEALGGIDALVQGAATAPEAIVDTQVSFNDTLGGAATGLGQGLGSSAVLTAHKLLRGGIKLKTAYRRDEALNLNASRLVSAQALSTLLQKAVELLNCQGLGGLFLLGQGLAQSGALSPGGFDANTTNLIKSLIPTDRVNFTSNGNTYSIDGQQLLKVLDDDASSQAMNGLSINGVVLDRFVSLLIVHAVFAIVAFAMLLPLAITLLSQQNLALRMHMPGLVSAWTSMAAKAIWILGLPLSLILVLVFGILPAAKGAHFKTAHGILGLLTVMASLLAVVLNLLSARRSSPSKARADWRYIAAQTCNQALLFLGLATLATGFVDLSAISLCLTRIVALEQAIMLGFALACILVVGQVLGALDLLLTGLAAKSKEQRPAPDKPMVLVHRYYGNKSP